MSEFFIKIKNLSLITIIASVIIGVVLLVKPDEALQFVSLICGITILLLGVGCWISFFTRFNSVFMAAVGTLSLIVGTVVCVKYKSIISLMLFIFGIFLIISGVIDFVSAIDAKRNMLAGWLVSLIMAVCIIIGGIVVTVNPFDSVLFVTRLLGVVLIVYAVTDLISLVQIRKISKLKTVNDNNVDEVDVTQEDIED